MWSFHLLQMIVFLSISHFILYVDVKHTSQKLFPFRTVWIDGSFGGQRSLGSPGCLTLDEASNLQWSTTMMREFHICAGQNPNTDVVRREESPQCQFRDRRSVAASPPMSFSIPSTHSSTTVKFPLEKGHLLPGRFHNKTTFEDFIVVIYKLIHYW